MPDHGFGRCDGHHKMVDFRLGKIGSKRRLEKKAPGVPRLREKNQPEGSLGRLNLTA
jgi:hypothetical protein